MGAKNTASAQAHKDRLIALLDALLELDETHRIVHVDLLSADQRPPVTELEATDLQSRPRS